MDTLILKLFFVTSILQRSVGHLKKSLLDKGETELLQQNATYVHSLLSKEQLNYWNIWFNEINSPTTLAIMNNIEGYYGIMEPILSSTHLEEILPESTTVLIMEKNE